MSNNNQDEGTSTHTYVLPTAMVAENEVVILSPRHDI